MSEEAFRAFDPASDFPAVAELIAAVNEHVGAEWFPAVASTSA